MADRAPPGDSAAEGSAADARLACPNCGSSRVAAYCADCGQSQENPRKQWREHLEELLSTYAELDSATLRSFGVAMAKPGHLSREKLENRGGRYVTSLKLFLVLVVLYSIFFAFSPIKYGQYLIGLDAEFEAPGQTISAEEAAPDWDNDILIYGPELPSSVSAAFQQKVDSGEIPRSELEPDWMLKLLEDPAALETFTDFTNALLIYLPLLVIPAMIAVNGFLFRRTHLLFDHLYVALEVAAMMIVIIMVTAAIMSVLFWAGITMDEIIPFVLMETPAVLVYLTVLVRRFYGLGVWRAIGDAFLVFAAFALLREVGFYQALEILGRTL